MTISYNGDVSSASAFAFFRLLFRWRGSIWKIVFKETIVWTIAFLVVTFFYRTSYFLTPQQKVTFEELAYYFDSRLSYIPLTFILGFFVNIVASRWSDIFNNMGYVESQAIFVSNYVQGDDCESRLLRRAIVRYMCLTQALVFRDISSRTRQRFPTFESLVKAGFMLEEERKRLDGIKIPYDKYWAPTNWIYALIFRARKEGKISHDIFASKLCDEIKAFRYNLQMVCNYDWVPLPLVYPQAIFLAVYMYFGVCLVSRQFIITDRDAANKSNIDLVVPIMTMIQFFFVIGWVKVAQGLLNPFGTDDDDFECCYLLDKNLATSLLIADEEHDNVPEIRKDRFWHRADEPPNRPAKISVASDHPLIGSAVHAKLSVQHEGPVEMVIRAAERRKSSAMMYRNRSLAFMRRASHGTNQVFTEERDRRRVSSVDSTSPPSSPHPKLHNRQRASIPREGFYEKKKDKREIRRVSLHPSAKLFAVDEDDGRSARENVRDDVVPPDPSPTPHSLDDLNIVDDSSSSRARKDIV